jgi:hypothetical protein
MAKFPSLLIKRLGLERASGSKIIQGPGVKESSGYQRGGVSGRVRAPRMLLIVSGQVENIANVADRSNASRPVSVTFDPFADSSNMDR